MIFFDTETCGFHGLVVLIQWAKGDGPIDLHEVWRRPIIETLELIDSFCADPEGVVGFNLAFDWFHLVKFYTTAIEFINRGGDPNALPEDHIEEFAICEERARFSDFTIKPIKAMDLMLFARKGKYQTLMGRSDIKIRKIPRILGEKLAHELEARVVIDPIYFGRAKSKQRWHVVERKDDPQFVDVVLKFKSSGGLKSLAEHALKVDKATILTMGDVEIDKAFYPLELGYAPFAYAISNPDRGWRCEIKMKGQKKKGRAWPALIQHHINHWAFFEPARKYGADDVKYTRALWEYFGKPESGDDDSELACCVACVRWHGYAVDLEGIKLQRAEALKRLRETPISSAKAHWYITKEMNATEKAGFGTGTAKVVLEKMVKEWHCDCTFETKIADPDCKICGGTGKHPAAVCAQEVLDARFAKKEIELYDKILRAGRLHASFIVIGALSSRMSGADGLNPQGIKRTKPVRRCFTIADVGFILWGGDFDSFEICIADAAYFGALHDDLTTLFDCFECKTSGRIPESKCKECKATGQYLGKTCQGCEGTGKIPEHDCEDCSGTGKSPKKLHGLFSMEMHPGMTYEQIMATKGKSPDLYTLGKNGVFTMIYGGDWSTLVRKYGVEEEAAKTAFRGFISKRPGIKKAQQYIYDGFCSMRQPGGVGTKVEWHTPSDFVESLYKFPRYFILENSICKALFDLSANLPKLWRDLKIRIIRREDRGPQFVGGAVSSALYGAAFGIQGSNMRAATNHVIQSTGATATKKVQRAIWDVQPAGYHRIRVLPCNIHDEILCPTKPEYQDQVAGIVNRVVEEIRKVVPLVKMEWKKMRNWAEK